MLSLKVATISVSEGNLSATIVGVVTLVLFVLVGFVAGPNLFKSELIET